MFDPFAAFCLGSLFRRFTGGDTTSCGPPRSPVIESMGVRGGTGRRAKLLT